MDRLQAGHLAARVTLQGQDRIKADTFQRAPARGVAIVGRGSWLSS